MKAKKITALLLTTAMAVSTLAGCGSSGGSDAPAESSGTAAEETPAAEDDGEAPAAEGAEQEAPAADIDISEKVELRMFSISNAPQNQELEENFWNDLNSQLTEKLNCTIVKEYAAGTNYENNYQLAMASGEKYDMLQSGSWLDYTGHASKGAFLPLEDLLPVYAPDIWEMIPEERWEEVKVNGHIFGIPNISQDPDTQTCFMFREDLRKKYNCPEITDFESIATYLQAIKDNEPELLPDDDRQAQVYGTMFIPSTKYRILDVMGDMHSNFVVDPADPRKVLATAKLDEFKPFMEMMKDWSDRGFWPKSVLSQNNWGVMSVVDGKAAASFNGQFPGYSYQAEQLARENPGWEIDYFLFNNLNDDSVVLQSPATSNMMSISRTAENPERALMVANLLMTDEKMNQFVTYGYEGVNYELVDGKRDTSNINMDTNMFDNFPSSLVGNTTFKIDDINKYKKYDEFMADLESRYQPDPLAGFVLDVSTVEAQYNAINQVRIEFGFPLMAGLVDDADAAYDDYIKRLDDAGLEEVRAEFEKQLNAFYDANGRY